MWRRENEGMRSSFGLPATDEHLSPHLEAMVRRVGNGINFLMMKFYVEGTRGWP